MTGPAQEQERRKPPRYRYLLARLAGAQPDVLHRAKTDRVKYTAMGGVLLTTAGLAGVSAAFALESAVGLPAPVAVVAGVLWAVVILNLDRMLIISITRQSGWLRNLLVAVPRMALAVVIGSIVSVPLVLRIFEPEINGELQVMHTDNLIVAQEKLDRQFADIAPTQRKVDELQAIASGQAQPSVSGDPDVVAAQKRVQDAQAAYDKAAADAQCELVGTCGTGQPGIGEAYRQAKAKADEAKAALDAANAHLNDATAKAEAKISGSVASNREAAKAELATLVPRLEQRKADRANAQARLDRGELDSEGLLARLEALDRLTAEHGNMRAASIALTLLFLLIEVLPVVVKLLSIVGQPTLYDRLLTKEETRLEQKATRYRDGADEIEQDLKDRQVRQGKEVNELLVAKQTAIAKKAIDTWGRIAMSRGDEELARWYAAHSGQPAPAAEPAPAAGSPEATVPISVTVPLMSPVPPPAPPPLAAEPPGRPAGGGQTYQQFKAARGVPPATGQRNGGRHQHPR